MGEDWIEAQKGEQEWWGNCTNTLGEELKQLVYARYMGIQFHQHDGIPYQIDLKGKSVLDVGGGPASLVLKTVNASRRSVVDPCEYPDWVKRRYADSGINYYRIPGEELSSENRYDEVWMYNCLQHVSDPRLIIENCLNAVTPGGTFRIFEWINTPINEAHPVSMTADMLAEWTGERGIVVQLNESGCVGTAYCDIIEVER